MKEKQVSFKDHAKELGSTILDKTAGNTSGAFEVAASGAVVAGVIIAREVYGAGKSTVDFGRRKVGDVLFEKNDRIRD